MNDASLTPLPPHLLLLIVILIMGKILEMTMDRCLIYHSPQRNVKVGVQHTLHNNSNFKIQYSDLQPTANI